jgi:hypothetical protein
MLIPILEDSSETFTIHGTHNALGLMAEGATELQGAPSRANPTRG